MKKSHFFALRSRSTGALIRLLALNGTYLLTTNPWHPVFEAQDAEQLAKLLLSDTPDYNTSEAKPGWGGLEPADLEPVEVEVETRVTPAALPVLLTLESREVRSVHRKLAEAYAKGPLAHAPGTSSFVVWLAYLPDGHTQETLKDFVGKKLYSGNGVFRRHLYAVAPVPEEFVSCFRGRPGVLLVASELC